MSLWDLAGVHGINKYIWSILSAAAPGGLAMTTTTYGGLIPITTPQQGPEFNALNAPYIVYTYAKVPTGPDYWLESETTAYTIFSQSEGDVRRITNLLIARLNKADDTAAAINAYINISGSTDQKQFDYKTVTVASAQGAQPSLTEGGKHDGLVVIKYTYTHYDPTHTGPGNDSVRY